MVRRDRLRERGDAVAYHYPGPATVVGYPITQRELDFTTTAADLARLTAGRPHVWLITTRTFHGDGAGILRRALDTLRVADRTFQFHGVSAYRYSTARSPG